MKATSRTVMSAAVRRLFRVRAPQASEPRSHPASGRALAGVLCTTSVLILAFSGPASASSTLLGPGALWTVVRPTAAPQLARSGPCRGFVYHKRAHTRVLRAGLGELHPFRARGTLDGGAHLRECEGQCWNKLSVHRPSRVCRRLWRGSGPATAPQKTSARRSDQPDRRDRKSRAARPSRLSLPRTGLGGARQS